MTTTDFALPRDGSWIAIPSLGTGVIVHNASNVYLLVRLGVSSTSIGMRLVPDSTMVFDETVYVRMPQTNDEVFGSLRVSR